MRKVNLDETSLKPLKPVYGPDKALKTRAAKYINTTQGLSLIADPIMRNAVDTKINNSSLLTMTDKKYSRDSFTLEYENSGNIFPYTFITYMVFSASETLYYSPPPTFSKTRYPGKDRFALFLQIEETDNDSILTRQSIISSGPAFEPIIYNNYVPNVRLFKVELLDDTYCRIKHDDGYVNTCLTYTDTADLSARCEFELETSIDGLSREDLSKHSQVFEYYMQNSRGYIALSKILTNGDRTVILHTAENANGDGDGGYLAGSGELGPDDEGWPLKSLIRIRALSIVSSSTNLRKLDTTWVKYDSDPEVQNSMQIDQSRNYLFDESHGSLQYGTYYINSLQYQRCNFLLNTQYHNITGNELYMNITVLKNHLTPEGYQSENSPFVHDGSNDFCLNFVSRENAQHRTYHKIQSGTNQVKGDDSLYLSYTSNTDVVYLPGDKLTYFHMPESLKPYEWLNINYRRVPEYENHKLEWQYQPVAVPGSINFNYEDYVGLITSGAIPGEDPMTSDKIFKMRADYRYFSNWGDSGRPGNKGTGTGSTDETEPQWNTGDNYHGTWLCAWLQNTDSDENERKYGPVWMDRYYDDTRFSDISEVLKQKPNCVSEFISRQGAIGAKGYVDTPSEMTLDRGVLYAYHHLGQKDNKKIIDSFSEYIVQEDLDDFTQLKDGVSSPAQLAEEGDYNVYDITGYTYGKSKVPDPSYGDFRLSFWVHSDDWSKPCGHQILGNYVNEGFAVINDDVITPVLVYDLGTEGISLRNTNNKKLVNISPSQYTDDTATIDASNIFIHRSDPLGNITIIASTEGYVLITTLNLNGAIVDTVVIDDPAFVNMNKKIAKTATYKPTYDSGDFGAARGWQAAPQEVVYIMFEDGTVGQLNLVTGQYRNPEVSNFFVETTLLEVDILNSDGEPIYDGVYRILLDSDQLPVFANDKPVYVKEEANLDPTFLFWGADELWHITINSDLTVDSNNLFSGDVPEYGEWYFSWGGNTDNQAVCKPSYDQSLRRPIYIQSSPDAETYSELYVTDEGMFYIIDGINACSSLKRDHGGTNRLFYTKDSGVYLYTLTVTTIFTVAGSKIIDVEGDITSMKIDIDENIWLLVDNDRVVVYDKNFDFKFSLSLEEHGLKPGAASGGSQLSSSNDKYIFDIIREYRDGGVLYETIAIYNAHVESNSPEGPVVAHISSTGKITLVKDEYIHSESPELTWSYASDKNKNISNFDKIQRKSYRLENTLTFKFRAKNRFDPLDFVDVTADINVSNLSPGWHHFTFGYDAKLKSIAYFYIDGLLFKEITLTFENELGKHAFTDVMSKVATIGATQGYNNNLLCDYLKQPGYYFARGIKIKSYRLYNFNLYRSFIKSLSREHITIPDIKWVIPCGRRAHLDHVSKFHTHSLPGHKSTDYQINISNTSLSGDALDTLQADLSSVVYSNSPVTTNNIKFNWVDSV